MQAGKQQGLQLPKHRILPCNNSTAEEGPEVHQVLTAYPSTVEGKAGILTYL